MWLMLSGKRAQVEGCPKGHAIIIFEKSFGKRTAIELFCALAKEHRGPAVDRGYRKIRIHRAAIR